MNIVEHFLGLREAYKRTFEGEGKEACLADLARFCGATSTTFNSNELEMARAAGRREVWLRLQDFLNMDERDVRSVIKRHKAREGDLDD